MPLVKQHVQLLSEKLDTSRDDKTAPLGVVVEAQNCFREKAGEYRRRLGRAALTSNTIPSGGTFPDVWQLASYKDQLVALTKVGTQGMIWPFVSDAPGWLTPSASNAVLTNQNAVRTQARGPIVSSRQSVYAGDPKSGSASIIPAGPDIAVIPGTSLAIVAFMEGPSSGSIIEEFVDLLTGQVLCRNNISGSHPRVGGTVATAGASASVTLAYSDGTNLRYRIWTAADVLTNTPSTTGNVAMTVSSHRLDMMVYASQTAVVIAVAVGGGATVHLVEIDFTSGPTVTDNTFAADCSLAIGFLTDYAGAGRYFIATAGTTDGVKVYISTVALVVGAGLTIDATATSSVRNITGYTTATTATGTYVIIWDVTSATVWQHKTRIATVTAGAVTTAAADWIGSVALRSKAFNIGTVQYVVVAYDSTIQPSYFLMRIDTSTTPRNRAPICKFDMWQGNGKTENDSSLTNIEAYSTSVVGAFVRQATAVSVGNTRTVKVGIDVVTMTTDPTTTRGRAIEFADSLLVPAGQVMSFDGTSFAELGFPIFPEAPTLSLIAGGSLTVSKTYSYAIVYRHTDSRGRVHRSAPTFPTAGLATTAGNLTIRVVVPYLRLWGRDELEAASGDNVTIEIYRTAADGPTYYLLAELVNVMTSATVNYDDAGAVTDANLIKSTLLYSQPPTAAGTPASVATNGGILANHAPPQFTAMCVHRNRVFGISADDDSIWFSKPIAPGVGPEFSDALVFRIDDEHGAPLTVASMDDKLIVHKARAAYVVMGDGPDNLARGGYPVANRLPSGVGCSNPRSVISTPNGVWSHSTKGLHCIGRGLAQEDAGKPVLDWLSGVTVVDAIHEPARSWIRFFLSSGNCLIFDYYFNEWYKWTNCTTIAACLAGSTVYQVKPGATAIVTADSASVYTDEAANAYTMKVGLAWIATAGIKGFQRVWETQVLGKYVGAHDVCVDLSYDYVDTVKETASRTGADPWDFAIKPIQQKCSALKLAIYDGTRATGSITCVAKASLINGEAVTVSDGVNTPTAFTWDLLGTGTDSTYVKYINVSSTDLTTAAHMATALADAMAAQKRTQVFNVSAVPSGSSVALTTDAAGSTGNVTITETVANAGFTVSGMSGGAHIGTAGFRLSAWALTAGVKATLDKMASSRKTAA